MTNSVIVVTGEEIKPILKEIFLEIFSDINLNTSNISIDVPVNSKELCKFLNISQPTLIRWVKKGLIPCLRIGSSVRYDKQAVIKALEKKTKK